MQIKDIVAGKKYINKLGEEKVQWVNVGKLFIKDDGKMTVKFNEYINPSAFRNDKGEIWFNVFDEKPKEGNSQNVQQNQMGTSGTDYLADAGVNQININQVVADGRAYAEHYRKLAEEKAAAEAAAKKPSDEEWFKEHQHIVDTLCN